MGLSGLAGLNCGGELRIKSMGSSGCSSGSTLIGSGVPTWLPTTETWSDIFANASVTSSGVLPACEMYKSPSVGTVEAMLI